MCGRHVKDLHHKRVHLGHVEGREEICGVHAGPCSDAGVVPQCRIGQRAGGWQLLQLGRDVSPFLPCIYSLVQQHNTSTTQNNI